MLTILFVIISILIGYLFGSISNGILIGKIFFHIDIREQGSHNSGGTNTGRVLGKKVGLITIILDMLKSTFAMWICYFICSLLIDKLYISPSYYAYIAGFSACIGHSFPIFFNFKGGKIVACFAGICLATNWIICIIGLTFFFIVLIISKYVSLGSILTSIMVTILTLLSFVTQYGMLFSFEGDIFYTILMLSISLFLIYRHKENIVRLINGNENKVKWIK